MAEPSEQFDEVGRLTGLLLEGALQPEDRRRLEAMLLADPAALEYYQDYVDVHCLLHWQHGAGEVQRRGIRDRRRQRTKSQSSVMSCRWSRQRRGVIICRSSLVIPSWAAGCSLTRRPPC